MKKVFICGNRNPYLFLYILTYTYCIYYIIQGSAETKKGREREGGTRTENVLARERKNKI